MYNQCINIKTKSMKKILITGATGLIGRNIKAEYKDYKIIKTDSTDCDLFNEKSVNELLKNIKPTHLIHLAWITGNDYLTNPINYDYLECSLNLINYFKKYGGIKVAIAGTCLEYAPKNTPIKETDNLAPQTLYAKCKNELRIKAEKFAKEKELSFVWGRIFNAYGQNEKTGRLTSQILESIKNNKPLTINHSNLIRDYIYAKDIADAFLKIIDTDADGCINISSGKGITIADYVQTFYKMAEKEKLLTLKEETSSMPLYLVGDNEKLTKCIGYCIKYDHIRAGKEIYGQFFNRFD